jgi:hypothetical protein
MCLLLNPFAPGTKDYQDWQPPLDSAEHVLRGRLETARLAARASRRKALSAARRALSNANSPRIDR